MQERLERIVTIARLGVIGTIGIGTLAVALFSGCAPDFSNKTEQKAPDEKKEVKEEVYRDQRLVQEEQKVEYGPILFDPRVNMGLPFSESVYEELSRQDADKAKSQLQRTTNYRTPIQPVTRRSQFPITSGYQGHLQPLQPIQTQRAEDYQSTEQSYQPRTVPRTIDNSDN